MSISKSIKYLILVLSIIPIYSKKVLGPTSKPRNNTLMLKYDKWFEDRTLPGPFGNTHILGNAECPLPAEIVDEVFALKGNVNKILDSVLKGAFKGTAFRNLTAFSNKISWKEKLDNALSHLDDRMISLKLKNVHEEIIEVPVWSRGIEVAMIVDPFKMELDIRAYGNTIETPKKGITAPVLVVHSFRELEELKDDVVGHIVLFNSKSDEAQKHVLMGASMAGKYGAVAVLCRSPIQLVYSPAVIYKNDTNKVPAAMISHDDADKIERYSTRHDYITIYLCLTDQVHAKRNARNVFGDYIGSSPLKNQYVMITSHIASWNRGEGGQHDAVGIVLQLLTIQLFQTLHLQPKRSIRMGVLSAEESGLMGSTKWVERHHDQLVNFTAAIEADLGCLKAASFMFSGDAHAACIVREIMYLYEDKTGSKSLSKIEESPSNGLRIHKFGLPMISLNGDNEYGGYFETQHTFFESLDSINPDEMDKCLATLASTVYVLAELKEKLPRV